MNLSNNSGTNLLKKIKNYFLTGLLLIIPLFIAAYVFISILNLINNLNLLLPNWFLHVLKEDLNLNDSIISGALFFLFLLALTFLGYFSKVYFGKKLFNFFSQVITKLPFVGGIYNATSNLLDTMFSGGENFKGVGLIRYPNDTSSYSLAFITGKAAPVIQEKFEIPMINCFIPTTPNPTSGFYLIVPEADIIHLNIGMDAALGLLLSLGASSKKHL